MKRYGVIAAGALVASIPNIVFFPRQPQEFLARGDYVMRGNGLENAIWSALLPWHYRDIFRRLAGPNYYSDGVSAGLTSSGLNPIHIVFAAAILLGLWGSRRWVEKPLISFLLATWVVAIAAIGTAGPSLTRLLDIAAGVPGFHGPGVRESCAMASATAHPGSAAHSRRGTQRRLSIPVRRRRGAGVCVVSRDANVVNFLTHKDQALVKVVEFYFRPLDPARIPVGEFRPDIMLIENNARFNSYVALVSAKWRVDQDGQFNTVQIPAW
jgi:hypothetical protein